MAYKPNNLLDKIFKSKDGKIVIWQNPNLALWGWIVFSVATAIFRHGKPHIGFRHLSEAALFTWAYMEIRSGTSLFRRILGIVVMIFIVSGFFK